MYVGGAHILITEHLADLPVPVGAKAITPAIPDAKHEPGKCGE